MILMSRFAKVAGWDNRELTLFTELWPLLNGQKKDSTGMESHETNKVCDETILPQIKAEAYANEDQILLEI